MRTEDKAMWRHEQHPSDDTLLLAIDHELPVERRTTVDQHLDHCERCRQRLAAIESTADQASRLYRHDITARRVNPAALRQRIQVEMADLGAALDRSWWFRVRRRVSTLPLGMRVGASLALVILAMQWLRPAPQFGSAGSVDAVDSDDSMTRSARSADEGLPIHALTPGAAENVSLDAMCAGQPAARPPIPVSIRQAVLRQYRMEHVAEHEYELDYLITPELGGVADQRNLWPERYGSGVWNARVKDDLEELLPRLVCEGTLALATAQRDIASDWIAAYKKYFRTDRPLATDARAFDDDDPVGGRPTPSIAAVHLAGARRSRFVPIRVSLVVSR